MARGLAGPAGNGVFCFFRTKPIVEKVGLVGQNSLPSPPTKNAKRVDSALLVRYVFGTLNKNRIFMRANNLCQKTDLFPPQKKSHPWFKPEHPSPALSHIPETSHPTKIDSWNPNNWWFLVDAFPFPKGIHVQVPGVKFSGKTYSPHLYHLHMLFIELSWRSLWILSDVDSNRAWKLSTPSHPYELKHGNWEAEMGKGSYYRESLEKSLKIICWIFLVVTTTTTPTPSTTPKKKRNTRLHEECQRKTPRDTM